MDPLEIPAKAPNEHSSQPPTPRRSGRATQNQEPNYGGNRSRRNSTTSDNLSRRNSTASNSRSRRSSTASIQRLIEDSSPDPLNPESDAVSNDSAQRSMESASSDGESSSGSVRPSNRRSTQNNDSARLAAIPEAVESSTSSGQVTRDSSPALINVPSTPTSGRSRSNSRTTPRAQSDNALQTSTSQAGSNRLPGITANQRGAQKSNPASPVGEHCVVCGDRAGEDCWGLVSCRDKIHEACIHQLPAGPIKPCPACGEGNDSAVQLLNGDIINVRRFAHPTPNVRAVTPESASDVEMRDPSVRNSARTSTNGDEVEEVSNRRSASGEPLPPQPSDVNPEFPKHITINDVRYSPIGFVEAGRWYWVVTKVLPGPVEGQPDGPPFFRLLLASKYLPYNNRWADKLISRGDLNSQDKWEDLKILGIMSPKGGYERVGKYIPHLYFYIEWEFGGNVVQKIFTRSYLSSLYTPQVVEQYIKTYIAGVKELNYPSDIFDGSNPKDKGVATARTSAPPGTQATGATKTASARLAAQPLTPEQVAVEPVFVESSERSAGNRDRYSRPERIRAGDIRQSNITPVRNHQGKRGSHRYDDDPPRVAQQPTPDWDEEEL